MLRSGPGYAHWPSWAPDGRRLAFSESGPDLAPSALYVMDADGGGVRPLGLEGCHPAWSPDGQRIAYLAATSGGGNPDGVWVAAPDGSGAARVPTAHYGECPRDCYLALGLAWWRGGDAVAYGAFATGTGGAVYGGQYTTRLADSAIVPVPH